MFVDKYPVHVVASDLNFPYVIKFREDLFLRVFNCAIFFTIAKNAKFSTSKVTAEQNVERR